MSDDEGDILGRWVRGTDPTLDPITGDEVRARAARGELAPSNGPSHRRRWAVVGACAFLAVALGAAVLARGGDDDLEVTTGPAAQSSGDVGAQDRYGTVTVQLDRACAHCIFIEGFEVGLRFETADGEVIASTLWSDFVNASGNADIDAYYDSVLTQRVPVGTVVVEAVFATGAAGPPAPPDLEGPLPCRLSAEVAPGGTVAGEVLFNEDGDCLRLLDPTTTTSTEAPPTTTSVLTSPPTTAPETTEPATSDAPLTTTSIAAPAPR